MLMRTARSLPRWSGSSAAASGAPSQVTKAAASSPASGKRARTASRYRMSRTVSSGPTFALSSVPQSSVTMSSSTQPASRRPRSTASCRFWNAFIRNFSRNRGEILLRRQRIEDLVETLAGGDALVHLFREQMVVQRDAEPRTPRQRFQRLADAIQHQECEVRRAPIGRQAEIELHRTVVGNLDPLDETHVGHRLVELGVVDPRDDAARLPPPDCS